MIRLRAFRPGDEDALRAVFTSAVREVASRDYTPAQIDAWAPLEWDADDLADWAKRLHGLQPFVAEIDERVAGYADLQPDGYIDHFFVSGTAGGQGVGGALMRRILAQAQARGLAELTSHVSLTAQPFYAHFGFEIVEQCRPTIDGVELENALMRKQLRPAATSIDSSRTLLAPFAAAIPAMTILATTRLRLEPFTDDHVAGLNAVNADPEVMRYISGRAETLDETRAVVERVKRRWASFGYAWWAFVETDSGEIVGSGCVQNLRRDVRPEPDPACPLEIGWRLRRDRWGRGLATEAARAMAGFAFEALRADELYAVCDPANAASAQVMQRLGMLHLGLQTWYGKECNSYRMAAAAWRAGAGKPDPERA